MEYFLYNKMDNIKDHFPKKLSSIYKNKKDIIQLKSFPLNFKTIPNYIDLIDRKIDRKIILHSHQIFQNEHSNMYNYNYLNTLYENLYKNKRHNSFSKNNKKRNYSSSNNLIRKDSFSTTGTIEDSNGSLKLPNINNKKKEKKNKMIKENLDFSKGKGNFKLLNVNKKLSLKRKSLSHVKEKKIIYPN